MTKIKVSGEQRIVISDLKLKGDSVEIEINKKLLLHLSRSEGGFCFDFYKYATEEELSRDDYDYDSDFIDDICLLDGQLQREKPQGEQNGFSK